MPTRMLARISIASLLLAASLLPGCGGGGGDGPPPGPRPLQAETQANPDTQDFAAPPDWVLLTVELPDGYDPHLIDFASVHINGWIHPDPGFQDFVDLDGDSLLELQIRCKGFPFVQSLGCLLCDPAGDQTDYLVSGQTDTALGLRDFRAWGAVTVMNMPLSYYCGAQPYVQNQSFEYSADPYDQPDCWQYFDADDADEDDWAEDWFGFGWIDPFRDDTWAYDGDYSVNVIVYGFLAPAGRSGLKQRVAVFAGELYAFWAWVDVDGLTTGAAHPADRVDMELRFYDQDGNLLPTPPEAQNVNPIYYDTAGWDQMFTADFTAPADAVIMEIALVLILNAPPVGDIYLWFDDVW